MAARTTTFRDLIERVTDVSGGITLDQNHTKIKRAVNDAARDLFAINRWNYAIRDWRVYFNASYATGTIGYTNSTRAISSSGATFPTMTDAANWSILIAGNIYQIESRTSSSALVLHPTLNPGADIATGTSYTLFQNTYDLPDDFLAMYGYFTNGTMASYYLPPEDLRWLLQNGSTSASPFYWTVMHSPLSKAKYALKVLGYPSTAKPIFFLYRQGATDLKWSGLETAAIAGTVSVTSGSATITGVSTTFDSTMEGRIIRIGAASGTVIPTSNDGLTPYSEELRIKTVASATSATAYTNATQSISTAKYTISDIVDIAPAMLNALQAGCEWRWAKDIKEKAALYDAYKMEVRRAMECDSHTLERAIAGSGLSTGWLFRDLLLNPPS